ncbi:MAG: asparagine synthase (glutamine-hydrolyzing) [Polyangia bacterium]
MCGVAAVIGALPRAEREQLVTAMCEAMQHRGPDGHGVFSATATATDDDALGVTLGHRRLAIVDLSPGGAQPMQRGALCLSWNGELYNHVALRAELVQCGAALHSRSDTEVLLALCERLGPQAALQRSLGPLALLLWDAAGRRLHLARDRFGKKPLYYLELPRPGVLVIASEPKALALAARRLGARLSVDAGTLACYLADAEHDVGERTFFAEIRRVPPGTRIEVDLDSGRPRLRAERYYTLRPALAVPTERAEALAAFRALLADALRLRLACDVPVGALLSGGLDSSSLVCLAAAQGARLPTFSAVHRPGEPWDERGHIACVVAHTGVPSALTVPEEALAPAAFTAFVAQHDEPVGGASIWAQHEVFQLAKRHGLRVLLSGQGADEALTGYRGAFPMLLAERVRRRELGRLGPELQRLGLTGGAAALALGRATWTALRARVLPRPLDAAVQHQRWRWQFRDRPGLHLSALPVPPPPVPGPWHDACDEQSLVHGYLYRLLTGASLASILRYEDRNSMAASIESRAPFLDHRLVELCLALPVDVLLHGGRTKAVLRDALADVLPGPIRDRRDKVGFAAPEARYLLGPLRPLVQDLLASPQLRARPVFDGRALIAGYQRGCDGGPFDSYLLWKALNVELWLRAFELSL